jgi:hypothetical protein
MIVKYLSKFVLEVLPSVVATIVGAYIVNHYITKPAADAPVAAAVSTVDARGDAKPAETKSADAGPAKADVKSADRNTDLKSADIKGPETSSETASAPEPGPIRMIPLDKAPAAEKPAETASLPADTRRHASPPSHDKAIAKLPAPAAPPAEAETARDERHDTRDANDLARAAIERLRNSSQASRAPDTARPQETARVVPGAVPPLPPAIMVSTPSGDAFNPNSSSRSGGAPFARADDPRRPTPPADIPTGAPPPIDLHAEATASLPERPTVAEDMLSAAKSVFHAVLPR